MDTKETGFKKNISIMKNKRLRETEYLICHFVMQYQHQCPSCIEPPLAQNSWGTPCNTIIFHMLFEWNAGKVHGVRNSLQKISTNRLFGKVNANNLRLMLASHISHNLALLVPDNIMKLNDRGSAISGH